MIGLGSDKNKYNEINHKKTHFEEGTSSSHNSLRDGSGYQTGCIFGNPCISYYLALVPPRIYSTISIIKNATLFSENGGGRRPLNFSENSSDLEAPSFPRRIAMNKNLNTYIVEFTHGCHQYYELDSSGSCCPGLQQSLARKK